MAEEQAVRASAAAFSMTALVPIIRVTDVEHSAEFYRLLGFEIGNRVPREGKPNWAWLYQPRAADWKAGANLMIASGERPPKPDAYEVLIYLYATDMTAVRERLIAAGVKVSDVSYPFYLPAGEFSAEDPDGYCLMIAQAGAETP